MVDYFKLAVDQLTEAAKQYARRPANGGEVITLYTVQFSLKNEFAAPDETEEQVSMITVDVFAKSEERAIAVAKEALSSEGRYDIDSVEDN